VFWFQGEQETAMRQLKHINVALKVRLLRPLIAAGCRIYLMHDVK
jgi:hypothetical protein